MSLQKGENNAITDVAGVQIGHVTLYEKLNETDTICTGVTAILPHGGNIFQKKCGPHATLSMVTEKQSVLSKLMN